MAQGTSVRILAGLLVAFGLAITAVAETVTFYRCVKDGHTTISDRPCGADAKADVKEYAAAPNEPSVMAQPPAPSSPTARPQPKAPSNQSAAVAKPGATQTASCEYHQRQIDSINERMRQGYTSQQGEYLRELLRDAQKAYSQCKEQLR